MTQNEKDLLLIDICARLPYNVAIDCRDEDSRFTCYLTTDMLREIQNNNHYWEYKPYLFPLESMTEEQKNEYHYIVNYISSDDTDNWTEGEFVYVNQTEQLYHFYHRHHLDYRGLIAKDLAIDATGLRIYEDDEK